MLRKREELELDSFFSEKFFYYHSDDTLKEIDIPLPDKPENLKTFLNSKEGRSYKAIIAKAMCKIKNWANQRHIVSDHCDAFIDQYLNNDFSAIPINFTLYKEGMLYLIRIADFLELDIILEEVKRYIIKNLIAPVIINNKPGDSGITVCGPGVLKNSHDAYLKLSAYLTLSTCLLALRKELTEQIIQQIIKELRKKSISYNIGNEMHYVNAVINRYTNSLSIPMILDEAVNYCEESKLYALFQHFEKEISTLTVEILINRIITSSDVDPNGLLESVKNDYNHYNEHVNRYIQYLDSFGIENKVTRKKEEENQFLKAGELFTLNEEGLVVSLKWSLKYHLFLSLFNRLRNMGYIDLEETITQCQLIYITADLCFFYYRGRSLQYAYVEEHKPPYNIDNNVPLIPYFIENVAEDLSVAKKWLSHFDLQQQLELVKAINEYLSSEEFKNLPAEEKEEKETDCKAVISEVYLRNPKAFIKTSKDLELKITDSNVKLQIRILKKLDSGHIESIGISTIRDYLKFLSLLKQKAKFIFIDLVKDRLLQEFLSAYNEYDLIKFINCFNDNHKFSALNLLPYAVIVPHTMRSHDPKIFDLILKPFNVNDRNFIITEFFKYLKNNKLDVVNFGGIQSLKKILVTLDGDEFVSCFSNENIYKVFKNNWNEIFPDYIQENNDNSPFFLVNLIKTKYQSISENDKNLIIKIISDFPLPADYVPKVLDILSNAEFRIEKEISLLHALLSSLLAFFKNNQFDDNEQRFKFISNIPWNRIDNDLFYCYIKKFYYLLPGGEVFDQLIFGEIPRFKLILSLNDPITRTDIFLKYLVKSFNDPTVDIQDNIKLLKLAVASFNRNDNIYAKAVAPTFFDTNNQHYINAMNTLKNYENTYGKNRKFDLS